MEIPKPADACDTQIEMSALAPVIHSPLTVFAVWEIDHDPDIQGNNDYARTGSAQVHSRTYRRTAQAARGCDTARTDDAPSAPAGPPVRAAVADGSEQGAFGGGGVTGVVQVVVQ